MISPDEVAAGMLPPVESEAPASLVHCVASAGIALAEQLQTTVPDGRHRTVAQQHLVRALQAAYVGMQPSLLPDGAGPDDHLIPYAVVPADTAEQGLEPEPGEYPDLGLWVLGITTSGLHPLTRLVALTLAQSARPSGYIPTDRQPTLTLLAGRSGLTLQAVHYHLGDLVAQHWATRRRDGRHTATRHQLRLPNAR